MAAWLDTDRLTGRHGETAGDATALSTAIGNGQPMWSASLTSTMTLEELPDGWSVWNREPGDRLILAFRPDVFDGSTLPPACLPTIYVREGERDLRRAGPAPATGTEGVWTVSFILEPEVIQRVGSTANYEDAELLAIEHAQAVVDGEVDFGEIYQLPHEEYIETLWSLVG